MAGRHARELLDRAGPQRVLVFVAALIGTTLAAAGLYALTHPHEIGRWSTDTVTVLKGGSAAVVVGLAMLTVVLLTRRQQVRAGFATAMGIFWLAASLLVAPALNAERSGRALVVAAERNLSPGARVGLVDWPEQFLLYWNGPVSHFGYRRGDAAAELRDATRWLVLAPERRLLLPATIADGCFDVGGLVAVGSAHRRDWVLAGRDALSEACAADAGTAPELVYNYWAHGNATGAIRLGAAPAPAAKDFPPFGL